MKRVGIIVGHSYKEQGAVTPCGVTEYMYNSDFAELLAVECHKLDKQPIIFYRDKLSTLGNEVNATNVDVAISLHFNAFNNEASGTETLYWHGSVKSKDLATRIQKAMVEVLGLKDRGIKAISSSDRGGVILRDTAMPCVLIEPFFGDNAKDFEKAEFRMEKLAEAIAEQL